VTRRVRLGGNIAGTRLKIYAIYSKSTERIREEKPIATLPLPISGDCRWYYGGITQNEGLERVARGAPRRYTALDQPDDRSNRSGLKTKLPGSMRNAPKSMTRWRRWSAFPPRRRGT
jgi:hypothetical protein